MTTITGTSDRGHASEKKERVSFVKIGDSFMMSRKISWLVRMIIPILTVASCQHDPVIPPEADVSFGSQVLPVILSNCATEGCHSGIANGEEELIPLTTYSEIMAIVKQGDPKNSDLYERITLLSGEDAMPPGRPLSEEQIQLIYVWISKGANNN